MLYNRLVSKHLFFNTKVKGIRHQTLQLYLCNGRSIHLPVKRPKERIIKPYGLYTKNKGTSHQTVLLYLCSRQSVHLPVQQTKERLKACTSLSHHGQKSALSNRSPAGAQSGDRETERGEGEYKGANSRSLPRGHARSQSKVGPGQRDRGKSEKHVQSALQATLKLPLH